MGGGSTRAACGWRHAVGGAGPRAASRKTARTLPGLGRGLSQGGEIAIPTLSIQQTVSGIMSYVVFIVE